MHRFRIHSIALKLNEMGLRTNKGGIFKGKGVWQILQNEKYVGVQIYGNEIRFVDEVEKIISFGNKCYRKVFEAVL